jgi:hypothetical protein
MGFVTPSKGEDSGLDQLTGRRRTEQDPSRADAGLELDLDLRVCATCRRELMPWEDRCPADGGEAIAKTALAPPSDPLLDRLLAEQPDLVDDPADDPSDGADG